MTGTTRGLARLLALLLVALLLFVSGCASAPAPSPALPPPSPEPAPTAPPPAPTAPAPAAPSPAPAAPAPSPGEKAAGAVVPRVAALPAVDGKAEGYPAPPFSVAAAEVYMAHDGSALQVLVKVEGDGWVSAGFNTAGRGMDGASLILGSVENGVPLVRNDLGRGWTHSEAANPGILDAVVVAEGGFITLEFSYPLDFPPGFRLEGIVPGELYALLVAYNNKSPDLGRQHSARGALDFSLAP